MNFEQIVETYSKLAYKIALDMTSSVETAADLVQDSYLSLYANFGRYRHLPEREQKNILCKIVLNKCRDYLRKQHPTLLLEEQEGASADFVEELLARDVAKRIGTMMRNLRPPYGVVLTLYYLEERSIDEIAAEMKTTNGTVRVQLNRGRKELKEIIQKEGGYGPNP